MPCFCLLILLMGVAWLCNVSHFLVVNFIKLCHRLAYCRWHSIISSYILAIDQYPMIVYKLRYKLLLLKSDFLKILHPVSSKCLNSVLLSRSMQVDLSSIDQIKFNSISSHFAGNTIRNYCCCDSKSTMMPTSTSTEQNEFENIKKLLQKCLDDVVTDQKIHQGSLVSNTVIHQFCKAYSALTPELRERVLMYISSHYGVDHCRVEKTCEALLNSSKVDVSTNPFHS